MIKNILFALFIFLISSCTKEQFITENNVDLDRFLTKWYVIAGRFTSFENDAYNPIEKYSWGKNREYISVDFTFNQGSFNGKLRRIPQKAWVYNPKTNAHWKIRPFWPLKLNYLILAVAEDYSWAAVGVPNQKYLWIMAKTATIEVKKMEDIIEKLNTIGYSTANIEYTKHSEQTTH